MTPRAKRGDELRQHILLAAKDAFLELGFERTSMDVVATRAATSKRTLYAHFKSKDALFLEVITFVRELYLDRLQTPAEYGDDPVEAVVRYCSHFQRIVLWEPQLRTLRLVIAEAPRLPEAAARHHDTIFAVTQQRLAGFLRSRHGLDEIAATDVAEMLVARVLHPRVSAALLGVERPRAGMPDALGEEADLAPLRRTLVLLLSRS